MRIKAITLVSIILLEILANHKPVLADMQRGLDLISKFAEENCDSVKQSGDTISEAYKGKIEAGISGLFKRLADAGAQGSAEVNTQRYSGVLQSELAGALNDVRSCKRHIIDLLAPQVREIGSTIENNLTKYLQPGSGAVKSNPCSGKIDSDSLVILLGSSAFFGRFYPHTVIEFKDKKLVSVDRNPDKSLSLSLEANSPDGRYYLKIVNNLIEINTNNFYRIERESPSEIRVVAGDKSTYIYVNYINSQTAIIEGYLYYKDRTINISSSTVNIGAITMKGGCSSGG